MITVLKFVFGSGWWIAWHAVLLVSLVPLGFVLAWMRTMEPGKGPQGGEVMFMLLVLALTMLIGVSLVNGVLWAGTQPWPWTRRYLLLPLAMIVAWIVVVWILFALVETATGIGVSPQARTLSWWGLIASFAALYLANLSAMWAVRAA